MKETAFTIKAIEAFHVVVRDRAYWGGLAQDNRAQSDRYVLKSGWRAAYGKSFETAITKLSEVVQCATVTGAADYELRIVTRDMHAFDDFLREKILGLGLVSNIESRIVIRSVKNTTAAPLGLVSPYVSAQG